MPTFLLLLGAVSGIASIIGFLTSHSRKPSALLLFLAISFFVCRAYITSQRDSSDSGGNVESNPTQPGPKPRRPPPKGQNNARLRDEPPASDAVTAENSSIEAADDHELRDGPRVRQIHGIVWSYPTTTLAVPSLVGGRSDYPKPELYFHEGLIYGGEISWDGSYHFENRRKLCLSISNLQVPGTTAVQGYYARIGIGYALEIENAVFADNLAISKYIILENTFNGDNALPPRTACLPIIPISEPTEAPFTLRGQWEGTYSGSDTDRGSHDTTVRGRLEQNGAKLTGSILDFDDDKYQIPRARFDIEGWVVDGKISFVKRNDRISQIPVSYIGTYLPDSHEIRGIWTTGLNQGRWILKYEGEFTGSATDIVDGNPQK